MNCGRAIRLVREAQGMTVSGLAKKADISVPFLSLVERGKRKPSLSVLERIAGVLDLPLDALLLASRENSSLRTADAKTKGLVNALAMLMDAENKLRERLGKV